MTTTPDLPVEPVAPETPAEPEESPRGMRDTIKAQNQRIKELEEKYEGDVGALREQVMAKAFTDLGLDSGHGVGKAAFVTFEGEPAELAAFVEEEFGYTLEAEHPMARLIASGQASLDQVGNTAGSIKPPDRDDELQSAEARGDYSKTLRMKTDQMSAWFQGPR